MTRYVERSGSATRSGCRPPVRCRRQRAERAQARQDRRVDPIAHTSGAGWRLSTVSKRFARADPPSARCVPTPLRRTTSPPERPLPNQGEYAVGLAARLRHRSPVWMTTPGPLWPVLSCGRGWSVVHRRRRRSVPSLLNQGPDDEPRPLASPRTPAIATRPSSLASAFRRWLALSSSRRLGW